MQEKIHRNVPRHVLVVIQKRSRTIKKVRDLYLLFLSYNFFSHPDYTVGFGISPNQLLSAGRGLYRRWGISPRPEERYLFVRYQNITFLFAMQSFFIRASSPLAEMSIGMSCCHSAAKLRHLADSHKLVTSLCKLRDQRLRCDRALLIEIMHQNDIPVFDLA